MTDVSIEDRSGHTFSAVCAFGCLVVAALAVVERDIVGLVVAASLTGLVVVFDRADLFGAPEQHMFRFGLAFVVVGVVASLAALQYARTGDPGEELLAAGLGLEAGGSFAVGFVAVVRSMLAPSFFTRALNGALAVTIVGCIVCGVSNLFAALHAARDQRTVEAWLHVALFTVTVAAAVTVPRWDLPGPASAETP